MKVYLRKEFVLDSLTGRPGFEVVAYADAYCILKYATWPIGQTKPRKGCKTVMLNCVLWTAHWLPDYRAGLIVHKSA